MRIRRFAAATAALAAGAIVLSGCAAPQSEIVEGSSLSVAWNQPFYAYNDDTSDGNATANANIVYLTTSSFNYYDADTKLIPNTEFGTYEMVEEDPLTVKYTINDGVKWSDGTDVDAADMLLSWAANIAKFNNVEPETDDEGNVTNQDAVDAGVYFDSAAVGGGLDLVTETPEISDDNKSITLVYSKPYVDWEVNFQVGVAAHATYALAFPDEEADPAAAKEAVIKAIQDNDPAVLSPLSTSWSGGYAYVDMPKDKNQYLSNGAYIISNLVKDEFITLEANPDFTWGPKPKYEKITIRFIPDALAQVQALDNGEVSIIAPQSTADILAALEDVGDTTVESTADATYEHLDLTFNNGGPFDPVAYGGDAEKAKLVRQAFLMTIPRADIIDKLIKPLNPEAEINDSQTLLPGFDGYERMIEENGSAEYAEVDIAGATALLAEAGVATPVNVNFMYGLSNTRRQNQYQLIAASASQAGFNVVDAGSDDWGSKLGDGTYDAVLFGWQSTSTAVTASEATFASDGGNNLNGYVNDKVDAAYDTLQGEYDKDKQLDLLIDVETELWADAYGVTVFQFPGVTAWSSNVDGVVPAPLAPQFFWNYPEWTPAAK